MFYFNSNIPFINPPSRMGLRNENGMINEIDVFYNSPIKFTYTYPITHPYPKPYPHPNPNILGLISRQYFNSPYY